MGAAKVTPSSTSGITVTKGVGRFLPPSVCQESSGEESGSSPRLVKSTFERPYEVVTVAVKAQHGPYVQSSLGEAQEGWIVCLFRHLREYKTAVSRYPRVGYRRASHAVTVLSNWQIGYGVDKKHTGLIPKETPEA